MYYNDVLVHTDRYDNYVHLDTHTGMTMMYTYTHRYDNDVHLHTQV